MNIQAPVKLKRQSIVKYTSGDHGNSKNNPLWGGKYGKITGTIFQVDNEDEFCYRVKWSNGEQNSYTIGDLELVEPLRRGHPLTDQFKDIRQNKNVQKN